MLETDNGINHKTRSDKTDKTEYVLKISDIKNDIVKYSRCVTV